MHFWSSYNPNLFLLQVPKSSNSPCANVFENLDLPHFLWSASFINSRIIYVARQRWTCYYLFSLQLRGRLLNVFPFFFQNMYKLFHLIFLIIGNYLQGLISFFGIFYNYKRRKKIQHYFLENFKEYFAQQLLCEQEIKKDLIFSRQNILEKIY